MKNYCLGFRCDSTGVLLIEKRTPEWQRGLVNGLGGHVEDNESAVTAMVREFREESGIDTEEEEWHLFSIVHGYNWTLYAFVSFGDITQYEEDHREGRIDVYTTIPDNMEQTADWLLRSALDDSIGGSVGTINLPINREHCPVVVPNHKRRKHDED